MFGNRLPRTGGRRRAFGLSSAAHGLAFAALMAAGGAQGPQPNAEVRKAAQTAVRVKLTAPLPVLRRVAPTSRPKATAARGRTPAAAARFVVDRPAGPAEAARAEVRAEAAPAVSATSAAAAAPVPAIEIEVGGPRVRDAGFLAAASEAAGPRGIAARTGAFASSEAVDGSGKTTATVSAAGFGGAARDFGSLAAGRVQGGETVFGRAARLVEAAPKTASLRSRVEPLRILEKPRPAYTEEARRRGIEGEVTLRVLFRADGTAEVVELLSGLGAGLDRTAAEAARRIRFKPAERDGRPVDVTAVIRITFQMA